VPEDLIKVWLGHSKESITDYYATGLEDDLVWRREWCERAGLGFSLDRLYGPRNVKQEVKAKAAYVSVGAGLSGAPGGTRTPDLLVRRGISRTTPAHSRRQQPMKSTREGNWFRLVSAGVGQGSRTLTRTLLALPYSCASREVDSGCGVWGKLLARAGKLGWSCAGEELAHCVEEGLGALSFGHDSVDAEMVRSTYFGGVKTEEQNRCSWRELSEDGRGEKPVHSGHGDVEHDQIGRLGSSPIDSMCSVLNLDNRDVVEVGGEDEAEGRAEQFVVVNNENRFRHVTLGGPKEYLTGNTPEKEYRVPLRGRHIVALGPSRKSRPKQGFSRNLWPTQKYAGRNPRADF